MFGSLSERITIKYSNIPINVLHASQKNHTIEIWAKVEFKGQKFLKYSNSKARFLHDIYQVTMRCNKFIRNGAEIKRQNGQKLIVKKFLQKNDYIILEALYSHEIKQL